jgi:protein involved in sex pheromone biosynthesis
MANEPFSWEKFFGGLTTVVGWAKFASFWVKALMIAIPILSCVLAYRVVYNKGYNKGVVVTRAVADQEFKQWIAEHPQQTFGPGSTANNNVAKKNDHFQIGVFPFRIGWCE